MKIIPVIDILNNITVHAIKGNRQKYQPLKSALTTSINPIEIATVFKSQGFSNLYIADLDAILGKTPNFNLYTQLAHMGFTLMIDAGVTNIDTIKKLKNCGTSKIIIGTETLTNTNLIKEAIEQIGTEHIIVSLDMKTNKILTHPRFNGSTELFKLIKTFRNIGVSEFILLDLSRVGSNEGVNIELLKQTLTILNDVDGGGVYVGGGARGVDDLLTLKPLGVLGVLLATALHLGKIDSNVLGQMGLLF
ncbi:MAG: HisA/HisF-related TIM barrel protein [Candidatus Bathyarchaeota archaeon]|nr:HisA/HisF-related TIM barrel protein [Candidatus Termiticorpusculum sp.]